MLTPLIDWVLELKWWLIFGTVIVTSLSLSIKIVRPTHRAVVEFLGKYARFCSAGINFVVPILEQIHSVDITENMVDVAPQDIITKDNLNAKVDLMIYFKIRLDEENIKRSLYNVANVERQIVSLAQTTARNVIGGMEFTDVNSKRNILNKELATILDKETDAWGVEIVRVELKEITPPKDVQETMNNVIKAENAKEAAIDFASAKETEADGLRRAAIKEAEGEKQAEILIAEGKATAIQLVNEAAEKYFVGNAQELKRLETIKDSLFQNSKFVLGSDLLDKVSKLLVPSDKSF